MTNQDEQVFRLTHYLRVLKRRKIVFAFLSLGIMVAFVLGKGVGGSAVDIPLGYTSHLKLLVSPPAQEEPAAGGEQLRTWFASEQLLKQLVLSEEVLSRVIQSGELPYDWQTLRSMVSFTSDEKQDWGDAWGSFMLELDVEADTPEESQKVATLLSNEVIAYTQELGAREATESRKLLERLALKHKKQIEAAQESIVVWRKKNDIWDIDQLVEAQGTRISELETEREAKKRELAGLGEQVRQLQAYRDQKGDSPPYDILALETQTLDRLASARNQLATEVKSLGEIYTSESAVLRAKQQEYRDSVEAYEKERRSLFESLISKAMIQIAELETVVARIEADIKSLKQDKGLAKAQVELQRLQYELTSHRSSYQHVLEQINETRVQEQAKKHLANFTVVEKPLPGQPIGGAPSEELSLEFWASSLLLSLLTAGLATLGIDHLARDSHLRPQVEGLGLPILGTIPRLDSIDGHRRMVEAPDSVFAERIRSLIVNIMRLDKKVNKILVTSCWPEEGKSMVSVNLATGLGRFGLKVFLVDGDLRRPFLSKYFNKDDEPGLRQFLTGEFPLEELTQPTELDNVNFISAGVGKENAAELMLGRKPLGDLVNESDQRFLLIDCSPLSVCSDSVLLSDDVDGVIIVVNAKHWDGRAELDYVMELEEQGVPLLGVVLNNVRETELTYGYGKIHKGYYGEKKPKSALDKLFKR